MLSTLTSGGEAAVEALKKLKGETATSQDLEAVYNSSINKLRTAFSDLSKNAGESISETAIAIISSLGEESGFKLEMLDDGTAVITAIGNMVNAYAALYAAMVSNA